MSYFLGRPALSPVGRAIAKLKSNPSFEVERSEDGREISIAFQERETILSLSGIIRDAFERKYNSKLKVD